MTARQIYIQAGAALDNASSQSKAYRSLVDGSSPGDLVGACLAFLKALLTVSAEF